ncbi:unnamed protein product, partial [Meganyctiphanes norvegica]
HSLCQSKTSKGNICHKLHLFVQSLKHNRVPKNNKLHAIRFGQQCSSNRTRAKRLKTPQSPDYTRLEMEMKLCSESEFIVEEMDVDRKAGIMWPLEEAVLYSWSGVKLTKII